MKICLFTLVALCFVFIQSTWGFSCPCHRKRPHERRCGPGKTLEECPYGAMSDPVIAALIPDAKMVSENYVMEIMTWMDLVGTASFVCLPRTEACMKRVSLKTLQLEKRAVVLDLRINRARAGNRATESFDSDDKPHGIKISGEKPLILRKIVISIARG
ncbi:uncharacterized protein [Palaemon carinicauda]|uniref:uncharacterized protein n=1 Tax=Palaemon carinicauda TaxID=392227 RepID=UPI0035B5AA85